MRIRRPAWILAAMVFFLNLGAFAADPVPETLKPSAFVSNPKHTFRAVLEGVEVNHQFKILNKGSADLEIFNVRTD